MKIKDTWRTSTIVSIKFGKILKWRASLIALSRIEKGLNLSKLPFRERFERRGRKNEESDQLFANPKRGFCQ